MFIKQLNYDDYKGQKYKTKIHSDKYLSIEPEGDSFVMNWVKAAEPLDRFLEDEMLSDWLDDPVAYGAFEDDGKLLGFVEGFLEKWNNRFRITNLCVFASAIRGKGVGTRLLDRIMKNAAESGARMAVLETQSYNANAISFYKKHGFVIIGFDRFAYSNDGPAEHNMRIEMGKKL